MTPEQRTEASQLYDRGARVVDIAAALDAPYQSVYDCVNRCRLRDPLTRERFLVRRGVVP